MRLHVLLAAYGILHGLLLGVGIAVGFVLVWAIPDIGIGTGIVIGVLSTGMSVHFFVRMCGTASDYNLEHDYLDEEGGQDDTPMLIIPAIPFPARRRKATKKRR